MKQCTKAVSFAATRHQFDALTIAPVSGTECTEGSMRCRMGIGNDKNLSRISQTFVRENLVANSLIDIHEQVNTLVPAEFTELLLISRLQDR